jgi:beta-glucanase (GH16 family)
MAGTAQRSSGPGRRAIAIAVAVAVGLGIGVAAVLFIGSSGPSSAASGPTVGFAAARAAVVEGDSGPVAVRLTISLSATSSSRITVHAATANGTATTADNDYVALSRTIDVAAGTRSSTFDLTVNGDTRLEDFETFRVTLDSPSGAVLGRTSLVVTIRNDEQPQVAVQDLHVSEGVTARFRPRLVQRYYAAISASLRTADGTARAGTDYTATDAPFAFAAGSRSTPAILVPTTPDAPSSNPRTFTATVSSPTIAGPATATVTVVEPTCAPASGTSAPIAAAPASPSGALQTAPPTAVTGGTTWDVVFRDEFDSAATTAAQWDTGTRSGANTLEGNHELEWYVPENSTIATDVDGGRTISVLRQRVTANPVSGEYYPVGVLSRVYPPAKCPQLYDAARLGSSDPSKVPYQFRSGMLNSSKSFGFKYGYVEARVRSSKGFALWPALWLRDWDPWSYEIDVLEGFDRNARVLRSSYWWGNGSNRNTEGTGGDLGVSTNGTTCRSTIPVPATSAAAAECSLADTVDLSAGYHTIGLNWTPTKYEFYLDGVKRWSSLSGANITSAYNHLIINLAFGNDDSEFDWNRESIKPLDPSVLDTGLFPKPTVEWDYVRVWQAPGQHDTCSGNSC